MHRTNIDRAAELLAIMMVGDGVMALVRPRHHMRLWTLETPGLREFAEGFERRPVLTRAVGAATIAAGLALAVWAHRGHERF